jgi:hypothetical protein
MPKNSAPLLGGPGPFGDITMGGLFAILKIRDDRRPAPGRDRSSASVAAATFSRR